MGRGRAPCCDKSTVKRGPWSPDEDSRLTTFIQTNGHNNWRSLPKQAGLSRCGKSCRLRWINYLRPDLKRGNFTPEEEEAIINLHSSIGNKWSKIASCLPGRTDNEIKNVWNTYLKKRVVLTRKNISSTSDNPKNGGDDESKMENSASPSCTSSSITETDQNMEKAQSYQEFQESMIKKQEIAISDSSTSSSSIQDTASGQKQEPSSMSKYAITNRGSDEKIEIPFDSDVDFWELLDPLHDEQNGEIQGSDLLPNCVEEFDCEVECSKWFSYIENEFGLTSDILPNEKHLEMDLEPEIGHELDYFPILPWD